ncbi:MAG TPA: cation:proton antiporter [Thermohalobaculum sp.]|nr:cation:proton antiporter [Thermohalobaculum sp.]
MHIVVFALSTLVLALVLVALMVPFARRIGLPLPVTIAAVGLAAGAAAAFGNVSLAGMNLSALDRWFVEQVAFDSSSLLFLFLPPLLFEMALSVNVRRLIDDLGGVMLMAVVAVVVATAFVGLAVWAVAPVGLVACLVLGAAVATTDPGAVITTFREIGAPRRLLVILEGESLLNDAAAIAIFTFLLSLLAAQAEAPTAAGVILGFLYSFGAGAAAGLAVAWVAARVFPVLGRSALAEMSMTMAVAYGAYLVADLWLGASGVVSVVFAGLATGSWGFVHMGPGNWNTVRAVWAQTGFWANSMILLLVSLLTPWMLSNLTLAQAGLVVLVYVAAFAARGVVIFGFLPVLERLGHAAPLSQPQRILVFWGGVRGSVTLILALALVQMPGLGTAGPVLGALAAAFTLATLFFNATTLAILTSRLGLDQLSPADLALRERIIAGSLDRVRSVITDIARARTLEPEALAAVETALGQRRREVEARSEAGSDRIPFGERLKLGLAILCGQEARLVRRGFEEGAIGPRTTIRMRLNAERNADAARTGGRQGYVEAIEQALNSAAGARTAVILHRWLRWDRRLREVIELKLSVLLESDRVIRALQRFCEDTVAPMIGEDAAKNLAELLEWRLKRVHEEIDAIELQYPAYVAALEQALIARAAIRRERQQYERLHRDGVIGTELRDDLIRRLDRRERAVARPPRLDLALSPEALIEKVSIFADLEPAQRRAICRRLKPRFTMPGEVVVAEGDRGTDMYFVASGALEVRGPGASIPLANGDFFGELALFMPFRRRRTSVVSMGFCRLLRLTRRDFLRLIRKDPAIETVIRRAAESQLGREFPVIPPASEKATPDKATPAEAGE